jgi:hypothetical protein
MRAQWCREHIDEVAEKCGLKKSTVYEAKHAEKFCESNSAFAECGTRAISHLLRVRDDSVRNLAISLAENALNELTPTGGKKCDRLTEPEIKKIIKKAEIGVNGEVPKKKKQEIETQPVKVRPQPGVFKSDKSLSEPQSLSPAIILQEPTPCKQESGPESDHDRRQRIAELVTKKQLPTWKPRHIARGELIYELIDQHLSEKQLSALQALVESGDADDEIDAILRIIDLYQEMQK